MCDGTLATNCAGLYAFWRSAGGNFWFEPVMRGEGGDREVAFIFANREIRVPRGRHTGRSGDLRSQGSTERIGRFAFPGKAKAKDRWRPPSSVGTGSGLRHERHIVLRTPANRAIGAPGINIFCLVCGGCRRCRCWRLPGPGGTDFRRAGSRGPGGHIQRRGRSRNRCS
jgi:hypothetical protein